MGFGKVSKHESYGIIGISRVTSHPAKNLFGSSVKHTHSMALRIKTASVDRHLNQDWYHAENELIEIEMSPTQFAEMITSLDTGVSLI